MRKKLCVLDVNSQEIVTFCMGILLQHATMQYLVKHDPGFPSIFYIFDDITFCGVEVFIVLELLGLLGSFGIL